MCFDLWFPSLISFNYCLPETLKVSGSMKAFLAFHSRKEYLNVFVALISGGGAGR